MSRLLVAFALAVLIVGVPTARAVRRVCRQSPGYRPWLVLGATALLIGVAVAIPHLDESIPDSMRESPAGLIPFAGAVAALCLSAIVGVAIITGAVLSTRPPPS